MKKFTIYHNPRCRKSREALKFLEEKGFTGEVIHYIEYPFTKESLQKVLNKIDLQPSAIVRKNETQWKDIPNRSVLSEDETLDFLVKFPKFIERPIVVIGDKGVLARPLENLTLFLKSY